MEPQDRSSQENLPFGVDPSELYSGPQPAPLQAQPAQTPPRTAPARVVQHPAAPQKLLQPIPPPIRQVSSSKDDRADILSVALDMLSARLLGVLALVAACAIWGYAVYDPTTPRTYAATLYSVTVLFPVMVLYWRDYWRNR